MDLYELVVAPFAEFDFMRYALASIFCLALSAAPVGVFLVMRRMSLVGDALSHAVLPGAAIGYMFAGLSLPAMSVGGFAAGLLMALLAGLVSRFTSLKEDANFAAFYLSSLAIGVVLVSKNGSSVDLLHLLFGSVLAVDIPALQLIAVSASVTIFADGGHVPPAGVGKHRPFVPQGCRRQGRLLACAVFGAGRDESGCGFSGIGYADVGRFDDVAGDYRQTVGKKHGLADDFVGRISFALRLGRTVVFLPYRNPVRPGDYFMLRHALPDFCRVRLGRRYFGKMAAPQETPHGMIFQTAA